MFYDRLKYLCDQAGISVSAFTLSQNLGKSTATHWKNGTTPASSVIVAVANYFGVSADYLLELTDDPRRINDILFTDILSPDERELIDALRDLPPHKRKRFLRALNILVEDDDPYKGQESFFTMPKDDDKNPHLPEK